MNTRTRAGERWSVTVIAMGALFGLAACQGGGGSMFVSQEDELRFGAEAHTSILTEYAACTACDQLAIGQSGRTVTQYVTSLGQRLGGIGNPDRGDAEYQIPSWHVTVLDSEELNAFAIPGGYVYVTTALLASVESEAELAGILGHEVAHVTQYHGVERLETVMIAQGLSQIVFGSDSQLAQLADVFVGAYENFVSGKDDEREADRYGVGYAFGAEYNPLDMNQFFTRIEGLSPSDGLSQILSTHPAPAERIENVREHAAELGVTSTDAPGLVHDDASLPYAQVAAAVRSGTTGGTVATGRFERLPLRVRVAMHACRFDPRSRRLVELDVLR